MASAHPIIQEQYLTDGVRGKVQDTWIASKLLAVRKAFSLGHGWNPVAQRALDLVQDNPALKVLEQMSPPWFFYAWGMLC